MSYIKVKEYEELLNIILNTIHLNFVNGNEYS